MWNFVIGFLTFFNVLLSHAKLIRIKCESPGEMNYHCINHCSPNNCTTEIEMDFCNCKSNVIKAKIPLSTSIKFFNLIGAPDANDMCKNCEEFCSEKNQTDGEFQTDQKEILINCDRKGPAKTISRFRSDKRKRSKTSTASSTITTSTTTTDPATSTSM